MTVGHTLDYNSQKQRDLPEFRWEGVYLVMDGSQVIPHSGSSPQDYRFGIDAVLALKMKWLVPNADRSYSLGPQLLLQFPRYPVEADQLNNKTFKVDTNGMVYLALVYTWRFVHLNDSFGEVTGWIRSSGSQPILRPAYLYCNVGESSIVGTQITNFLREFPYKDEITWWEPQHVQYHRVRGDTVEIVEVELSRKDGTLLPLAAAGEKQVTLHYKA